MTDNVDVAVEKDQPQVASTQVTERYSNLMKSPGMQVREAREKAGISMDKATADLRMLQCNIVFLEDDNYERLPGNTFIRGYFRAYAKYLKLDPEQLLKSYEGYLQVLDDTTTAVSLKNESEAKGSDKKTFILIAVAAVIIFSVVFAFDKPSETASTEQDFETIAAGDSSPSTVTTPASTSNVGVDNKMTANAVSETVASNGVNAKADSSLLLTFSEEAWVEVTDANSDVLLTALKQAGETVRLQGLPPYKVFTANASATKIIFESKNITVQSGSDGKTARLTIGQAQPN